MPLGGSRVDPRLVVLLAPFISRSDEATLDAPLGGILRRSDLPASPIPEAEADKANALDPLSTS